MLYYIESGIQMFDELSIYIDQYVAMTINAYLDNSILWSFCDLFEWHLLMKSLNESPDSFNTYI